MRGKVVMFRGGNPISLLVRLQTRSIYSHTALLIPGTNWVIESYPGAGVRKRCLTDKDLSEVDMYDVKGMTPAMWQKAIEFAETQLTKGYDWRSVLRFVSKTSARENGRWFCSELVHKSIAEGGIRLLERVDSAEVSPGHVAMSPLLVTIGEEPESVIS